MKNLDQYLGQFVENYNIMTAADLIDLIAENKTEKSVLEIIINKAQSETILNNLLTKL